MKIVSQNFNAWCPVTDLRFSKKIKLFAEYIGNKYPNRAEVALICIQEFIAGKNGKYLAELESAFDACYDVITPPNFNEIEHTKSLINVILIRKDLDYNVIKFNSCLPNRVCYVRVFFDYLPTPLRIMNIYAVQTVRFPSHAASWYITKRKEQKEDLWNSVLREAKKCTEPLLICGDMQEDSKSGMHIKQLTEIGFKEKNGGFFPTVKNDLFEAIPNIDHFLYNPAAWENFYPVSFEHDGNLLDELSDHILLAAVSA